jgi:hypothetical protein
MKSIFLLSIIGYWLMCYPKDHIIIVPGTWSHYESWHQPEGDFYTALKSSAQKFGYALQTFKWSGDHTHKARVCAGKQLARMLNAIPSDKAVHLVSHSHGTNVALIASQEIEYLNKKKKNSKKRIINRLYALGVPVDLERYQPNMKVIEKFYNFFSLGDYIQPLFGLYGRLYPAHPSIANIRIKIDSLDPIHKELHNECIGRWLLYIHEQLHQEQKGYFETFDFSASGLIHFYSNLSLNPTYHIDRNRSYAYYNDHVTSIDNISNDEKDLLFELLAHEEPEKLQKLSLQLSNKFDKN